MLKFWLDYQSIDCLIKWKIDWCSHAGFFFLGKLRLNLRPGVGCRPLLAHWRPRAPVCGPHGCCWSVPVWWPCSPSWSSRWSWSTKRISTGPFIYATGPKWSSFSAIYTLLSELCSPSEVPFPSFSTLSVVILGENNPGCVTKLVACFVHNWTASFIEFSQSSGRIWKATWCSDGSINSG